MKAVLVRFVLLSSVLGMFAQNAHAADTLVRCDSPNSGAAKWCQLDPENLISVSLTKELSTNRCRNSWSYSEDQIVVWNGCRAEFTAHHITYANTDVEVPGDYHKDYDLERRLLAALNKSPLSIVEKGQHILNRFAFGSSASRGIRSLVRFTNGAIDKDKSHRAMARFIYWSLQPANISDAWTESMLASQYPNSQKSYQELSAQFRVFMQNYADLKEGVAKLEADLKKNPNSAAIKQALEKAKLALAEDSIRRAEFYQSLRIASRARLLAGGINRWSPLQTKLTWLWFNRLNVDADRVPMDLKAYLGTINSYTHSKFEDMLLASAHSPAMLLYLNNAYNKTNDSKGIKPNEDYAREIMELHSLGVVAGTASDSGHYNLNDVRASARILSGWSIDGASTQSTGVRRFKFYPSSHPVGGKTVMGKTYADGYAGGVAFIRDLANHPLTARSIAKMLTQYFVSDQLGTAGPMELVNDLQAEFLAKDGDLQAVYRELFTHDVFWSEASYRSKGKDPLVQAIGVLAVNQSHRNTLTRADIDLALGTMMSMGMNLLSCSPPTGFSLRSSDWISASSAIGWMRFAYRALFKEIEGLGRTYGYQNREAAAQAADAADNLDAVSIHSRAGVMMAYDFQFNEQRYRLSNTRLDQIADQIAVKPDKRSGKPVFVRSLAGALLGGSEFRKY